MNDAPKVNISIENMYEFKELLQKASDQTEQLQKTLYDIEVFEFHVKATT